MIKNKRLAIIVAMLLLVASFSGIQAFAHGMIVEPLEDEKIKVSYDGGGFSKRTEVIVFDSSGNELEKGKLDSEGIYSYKGIDQAHKIIADDGLGHRVEWEIGAGVRQLPKLPVVGGLFVFSGGVAWYFNSRTKNKKSE